MAIILNVQFGIEGIAPDVALTRIGKRDYEIPCWLWMEWHGGGIRGLIEQYGLRKYRHQKEENAAIYNIERSAIALRRFYRRGHEQHYYNMLADIDRHLLRLEHRAMSERPHLRGQARFEWIAANLPRHYGAFHWRSVQVMLEDATHMLVIDLDRRELRHLTKLVKAIRSADVADVAEVAALLDVA